MNTPILDFVKEYVKTDPLRCHMPGHKGSGPLGVEKMDITEIDGADELYHPDGIIAQSESNASRVFGCPTFYSTEGSSQCIRAMLQLCCLKAKADGQKCRVLAGRNAHATFLSAAALLDIEVDWLWGCDSHYLACHIEVNDLEAELQKGGITAVYITSPDYLGNVADVAAMAKVCHKYGVLLAVDCAHGAYLKFLPKSKHPIDLGADICCCSAHKTLPVLTGGAYLQVGGAHAPFFAQRAKEALRLFGSTSPSYLILQSLDGANSYLNGDYPAQLACLVQQLTKTKQRLIDAGYTLVGDEDTKLSIDSAKYGYRGGELAGLLVQNNIVPEYYDDSFVVLMFSPGQDTETVEKVLFSIPQQEAVIKSSPAMCRPEKVMSVREAALALWERVPVADSVGKIAAMVSVSCPPAVPVVMCGEKIDESCIKVMEHYGIKEISVVVK